MAPIRVGLMGLRPSDDPTPGRSSWALAAHIRSILASPHYELVALCNSSAESSRRSIAFHKLPSTVKAYGSPEDLAKDPNVDLVVVSVRVAKHYMLTKPVLLGGKDVFVEWPLAANAAENEELARLAREKGVKTLLGLQMRADPMIIKVKELIESGTIGTVTSSVALGCSSVLPTDKWWAEQTYYLDLKSGGTDYQIYFGHFLDAFIAVLGDFDTVKATLKTQHPTIATFNGTTGEIVDPAHPKTSPDHVLVQGILQSGAVASIAFRKAKKPVDALGLRWLITGDLGEIEVTLPESHLQMAPEGRKIRLRVKDGDVQDVSFEKAEEGHVLGVSMPGTNTARLYEEFAQGKGGYADFDTALKTHKLLDRIVKDAEFI